MGELEGGEQASPPAQNFTLQTQRRMQHEPVRKLCTEPETRKYVYYLQGMDDNGFAKIWRCDSYLFHRFSDTCYDRELVTRVAVQHTYLKIYF